MGVSAYLRLGVMMFLEYAIWGAWTPVLALYLQKELGFDGAQTGHIYSLLWLACILSPFIGGQIVDRWVPTQWFLAAMHFVGGFALWQSAQARTFEALWPWQLVYALAFAPTLALTNSLAFKHLTNNERQFGAVRVFGTIGWIVAGLLLGFWRKGLVVPAWGSQADCFVLAAAFSMAMGAWCLLLPHTPPTRDAESPWAFLKALRMARDLRFLAFLMISFVVTTELQFYYMLSAPFLNDLGITADNVPIVKDLAQGAEILVMFVALPLLLPRLGFRRTLAIGVLAWPVRYVIWALVAWAGDPVWLVVASLTLHGVCYVFFFTVSQVYVDNVAPRDIRHSAQALLTLVTLGFGNYLGTHFTGWIQDTFTHPGLDTLGRAVLDATTGQPEKVTEWHLVFAVPIAVTVLCAIAFFAFFREPKPGVVIGGTREAAASESEESGQAAQAPVGAAADADAEDDRPQREG